MHKIVIIVAGGKGTRMQLDLPKQFLILHEMPVLMHTMNCFFRYDSNMSFILVLPSEYWELWNSLCKQYNFQIQHQLINGGETRFHSVKNGLVLAEDNSCVAIHDAARPFVSTETIKLCFDTALKYGSAVPVVDLKESLRYFDKGETWSVQRLKYKMVQTPQVFITSQLKRAYEIDFDPVLTDDASVFERSGGQVRLVEGNYENIKITYPIDIKIAEAIFDYFIATGEFK